MILKGKKSVSSEMFLSRIKNYQFFFYFCKSLRALISGCYQVDYEKYNFLFFFFSMSKYFQNLFYFIFSSSKKGTRKALSTKTEKGNQLTLIRRMARKESQASREKSQHQSGLSTVVSATQSSTCTKFTTVSFGTINARFQP